MKDQITCSKWIRWRARAFYGEFPPPKNDLSQSKRPASHIYAASPSDKSPGSHPRKVELPYSQSPPTSRNPMYTIIYPCATSARPVLIAPEHHKMFDHPPFFSSGELQRPKLAQDVISITHGAWKTFADAPIPHTCIHFLSFIISSDTASHFPIEYSGLFVRTTNTKLCIHDFPRETMEYLRERYR